MGGVLIVLPVVMLVLLALLRPLCAAQPEQEALGWKGVVRSEVGLVAFAFLLIFGGFVGFRSMVPDEEIWPESEVARRTNWLHRHLLNSEGWRERPVVIILGSSQTHYGVDPAVVEAALERHGTPATVLSFNAPGAVHHERLYMLERFLDRLSHEDRAALASTHVVFLSEVFDAYDVNPLYRLEREAGTERAIIWLNPRSAMQAWRAYSLLLEAQPTLPRWATASTLLEHTLLNRFAVGSLAKRKVPTGRKRRTPPFFALDGAKSGFDFEEAANAYQHPRPGTREPAKPPFPQWERTFGDFQSRLRGLVDEWGFVGLPTLERSRANYQKHFAEVAPEGTWVLGPADEATMEALMAAQLWFDGAHSTGKGAEEVSLWLAAELARRLADQQQRPKP